MIPWPWEIRSLCFFFGFSQCQKVDFPWWDPNFLCYGIKKVTKRNGVRIEKKEDGRIPRLPRIINIYKYLGLRSHLHEMLTKNGVVRFLPKTTKIAKSRFSAQLSPGGFQSGQYAQVKPVLTFRIEWCCPFVARVWPILKCGQFSCWDLILWERRTLATNGQAIRSGMSQTGWTRAYWPLWTPPWVLKFVFRDFGHFWQKPYSVFHQYLMQVTS